MTNIRPTIKSTVMRALFTLAMAFSLAGVAHAAVVTIDTSYHPLQAGTDNQGWWANNGGNSNATNDNYITGRADSFRSYFAFDLSGLVGLVTSAEFEVRRYDQSNTLTLALFDVSTPAAQLVSGRGGSANAAIFADLGTGISYGSYLVANGASSDVLTFALNASALADINNRVGLGYFAIGAAVPNGGTIFSSSSEEPGNQGPGFTQRLVLNVESAGVPEPDTLPLMGMAIGVLVLLRRRRAS